MRRFREPIDWAKLFNTVGVVACLLLLAWIKWEQDNLVKDVKAIKVWMDAPQKVQTYLLEEPKTNSNP